MESIKLRDYQEKIVNQVKESLDSHKRIVVSCPTGSGKTIIAIHGLLKHIPKNVAWITHRKELAKQIDSHNTGINVFMVQSGISGNFGSIIIDEGHHVCAAKYREIISKYKDQKIIALTATPYRLDGLGLGSCGFSKIIIGPDIYQLTNNGSLCPAKVYVPVSESTISWTIRSTSDLISKTNFKKGIVYCKSVKEAVALSEELLKKGISASSIDGEMDQSERSKIFDGFVTGNTSILCNHTIFTEGIDIPVIDLIVLNRHTHSRCLWKQMIGRGLRNYPGKNECTILDLAGNSVVHGSIYDNEIYDLNGTVEATEERKISLISSSCSYEKPCLHNDGEELKEWNPPPKPIRLIENLHRLRYKSPLLRFRTGLQE